MFLPAHLHETSLASHILEGAVAYETNLKQGVSYNWFDIYEVHPYSFHRNGVTV